MAGTKKFYCADVSFITTLLNDSYRHKSEVNITLYIFKQFMRNVNIQNGKWKFSFSSSCIIRVLKKYEYLKKEKIEAFIWFVLPLMW